jgi:F5/8 type C domain.
MFTSSLPKAAVMLLTLLSIFTTTNAQLNWPSSQLLPSFPAPAPTQDLIILRETNWHWEAEGAQMGHNTGRLETDGWLCQTGIDAPNQHMVYGPYSTAVPAGSHTAEFRMKVDNNTANNDPIVDIDVRNATTGQVLASQTLTRLQFPVASNYTNFTLPFTLSANNQSLELRIFWHGTSYVKVDWVAVQQNSSAEMYLFASLKGIVNRTQPRIFSYEGDAFAEGQYTWLQSLNLGWNEPADKWDLITKYRSELSGLIVYDPAQIHTVNLATMLAWNQKALIASPSLLARLQAAPYNLPILTDLRGQFSSKLQVYQHIYNNYWPNRDHRLLIGLNPEVHKAALREYATALGAAVIWLDPDISGESSLLNQFLSSMPAGANYMGWWPNEAPGVQRASQYGIATIASDWCSNLTMHSGMPRTINLKPMPPKPALQNKIYVAFILSDGDNLQYIEHLMRKLWNNPDRGSVPIGWTLSPAMVDAMPGALNFYWQTATNNDNLISGPSGYGYAYPNSFPNQSLLDQFVAKTEDYNQRAGFRVITIWNTITGGINQNVGQSFATHAPSTLGLTAQNTGGGLTIYDQRLPGMALSCNYCTSEQAMKDHIASAAAGWNGNQPRFIIIQAQPWTDIKPTEFKNVANSLNSNYVVVRPDHIFQLIREANGLPVDPSPLSGQDITNISGGVVSAQYQDSPVGEEINKLTDNNVNTKYLTFHASAWMQYQAPGTYVVNSYRITSANDAPERDPLNWTLQGSNNGVSWTTIDSRSNQDFPNRFQTRTFTISNNNTAYSYYRFNMNNNSGNILQVAEVELYGVAQPFMTRVDD